MDRIETFVEEVATELEGVGVDDIFEHGRLADLTGLVIPRLGLDRLSNNFADIMGVKEVESFYKGCDDSPSNSIVFRLGLPLARIIPAYCYYTESPSVRVDKPRLCDALRAFADCVANKCVPYTISLRLINIDIESDAALAEGVLLRKVSERTLYQKYPIEMMFGPLSPTAQQSWVKNRVELTVQMQGTASEFESWRSIEKSDAFINSIVHSFLLSDTPHDSPPFATHFVLSSPIKGFCLHHGRGNLKSKPTLLSEQDLDHVRRAFSLLESSKSDRVLEVAVDRYITGRRRNTHHPNRINQPNWDKIVDYVIALETLLLTVESSAMAQELSYRFRLNGSSLLVKTVGGDPRQFFTALKFLYELRSKVVHGCDDTSVLKAANKFIESSGIDREQSRHSIGRISIVSKKVEEWIMALFYALERTPLERRPYREAFGWEKMLWSETTATVP